MLTHDTGYFFARYLLTPSTMKLNRPAVLASISLLALGGLYYAFFRPGSEIADPKQVRHEPQTPQALIRPAKSTGSIAPLSPEESSREVVESEAVDSGVQKRLSGSTVKPTLPLTTPETRAIAADHQTSSTAPTPASPEDQPARPSMGIRLAPDVRLPVAALPNDLKLNPIRQQALQNIIDEYYQTVAAAVPAPGSDGGGTAAAKGAAGESAQPDFTTVTEENGEETVIIHNSPAVEAARARADYLFKALFGKAAYNRMTMNTLLESRLPDSPTKP